MIAKMNKHKNHITAISFIFIMIGLISGFIGSSDIKNVALIIATIIAFSYIFLS